MKIKLAILILTLCSAAIFADNTKYIEARIHYMIPSLMRVESNFNDHRVGDSGKAIGCLQIWKITVRDANRISGKSFKYEDRYDREKSVEIAEIVLLHYGKHYERTRDKIATFEVLARIFNGGYATFIKTPKKMDEYWLKVECNLIERLQNEAT